MPMSSPPLSSPSGSARADGIAPPSHTPGAEVVGAALRRLAELQGDHHHWYVEMEDNDPDICDRAILIDLIERAPTELALGFLLGKLTLREQIAAITGRPLG